MMPSDLLHDEPRDVALADVLGRRRLLLLDAEFFSATRPNERRFERLAELVVDLRFEIDCMDPIVGPHESAHLGNSHARVRRSSRRLGSSTQTQTICALPAPAARNTSRRVPSP